MVKALSALFSFFLMMSSCFAGAQPADCETGTSFEKNISELETVAEKAEECPKPTRDQLQGICGSIYDQSVAETDSGLNFKYLEGLWALSCADPKKESIEQAKVKIQKMWNANREQFRCYSFTGVSVSDGNVLKFSMDTNFPYFLTTAVKKYQLDMNFIDPADGKTMMDFLQTGLEKYKKEGNTDKAFEYQRIYDLFAKNGAKHAKDL